jgi:hypothetical protein
MPYVMVPVPEEHVEAVMGFTLRAIARASVVPWDGDSINQFFGEVDEATRSLLAFVARGSADGGELDAADVARKVQLTQREVLGIMNEMNSTTRDANRPNLLTSRVVTERLPNGRTTEKRVIQMEPDIADLVRAAERAELEGSNPGPGATE